MSDQPVLSPAERIEQALESAHLRVERARRVLADARYNLGVMQAEGRKARERVEILLPKVRAEIAAMRDSALALI
jgi:hypothetical protein